MKKQSGDDMSVGGADLASTFIKHGLIDEYRIYNLTRLYWAVANQCFRLTKS